MQSWYEVPYQDHYLRFLDHNWYYQVQNMVDNLHPTNQVFAMDMEIVSTLTFYLFGHEYDNAYMLYHPNNVDYLQLLPSDLVGLLRLHRWLSYNSVVVDYVCVVATVH